METAFKKPERVHVDALAYLSGILKNGLTKDLQDHQIICPVCQGTGLALTEQRYGIKGDPDKRAAFPYTSQYIVGCQNCFTGIVNLCRHCTAQLPRSKSQCDCEKSKAERAAEHSAKARAIFDKAIKVKADDEIAKGMGMYYFDSYPYNEGYFSDFDEFFEWWEESHEPGEERPQYVWGTDCMGLILDADSILENATEDLHEEAFNRIEEKDELKAFLEAWCAKQQGTTTYYSTQKYAIEIPWR
ncbi:hypothetical protein [Paenibacillus sp. EPM92]|uniref:hypothetical protein n=1 Tax=Paenibacillus sp. EPM92 TaxID=1561195 RepID=UPI001915E235|nr:hypothetical protein [Paenibacillus sp. EPM92]